MQENNNLPETNVTQLDLNNNISLTIEATPTINYVNYKAEMIGKIRSSSNKQNSFSFLKKVLIKNDGEEDIFGSFLKISFSFPSITTDEVILTCLEKKKVTEVNSFSINVDAEYLYKINEAVMGNMKVELYSSSNKLIAFSSLPMKILPIEEAASENFVFETLSSFVTPNDEMVKEVVNKAAIIQKEKYDTDGFDGYQSHDPDRVMEQIDSIYLAIEKEGIRYSNPPASFELTFQRLRLPRTLLLEKAGTCIDFSLLFASCLESIGLNPLLVIVDGHAFIGCFLEEATYQSGFNDNLSLLSNDSSETNKRIVLFNPVDASSSTLVNFVSSQNNAKRYLSTVPFRFFIDVAASRLDGILPLPTPVTINGKTSIDYGVNVDIDYSLNKINKKAGYIESSSSSKSKFDVWEEGLLDLNLSNNLINFKISSSNVQLGISDAYEFFSMITKREKWNLLPNDSSETNSKRFLYYVFDNAFISSFKESLSKGFINIFSKNNKTEDALKGLSRKASTQIEESGCNPLYLTLGVLNWFDNESSSKNGKYGICSPLLLIPASMPKRRVGPYYQIELDLDGIQFNTTLLEYFKQNFDMDFSEFDNYFDNPNIDLRKVFNTFRRKISSYKSWTIEEEVASLSLFSFSHFVMWNDIKKYKDIFIKNDVVSSFVKGEKCWENKTKELDISKLDEQIKPGELALPLPYDSSQLYAIKCSDLGESFVLDGPPGTGKSQTIANIIINALYKHKKVLFVAEKEVALQVVKKRLDELNLGQFCLQIHSAKANKKEVLNQLASSLQVGKTLSNENKEEIASNLLSIRNELNDLLSRLHDKKGYFVSPYEAILNYLAYEKYKTIGNVDVSYSKSMDEAKYNKCLDVISKIKLYGISLGGYYSNCFSFFTSREYSLDSRDKLEKEIDNILPLLISLEDSYLELVNKNGLDIKLSRSNSFALESLFNLIKENKDNIDYSKITNKTYYSSKVDIKNYFECLLDYKNDEDILFNRYSSSSLSIDESSLLGMLSSLSSLSFFARNKRRKQIKKAIRPFIKDKKDCRNDESISNFLNLIKIVKQKKEKMTTFNGYSSFIYSYLINKNKAEVEAEYKKVKNTLDMLDLLNNMQSSSKLDIKPIESYFVSVSSNPEYLFENKVTSFLDNLARLKKENERLKTTLGFDVFNLNDNDIYYETSISLLNKAKEDIQHLGEWIKLLNYIDEASSILPNPVISSYLNGKLDELELEPAFKCVLFYSIMVSSLFEEDLLNLNSLEVEDKINKYKKAIDEYRLLSVKETAFEITKEFPLDNVHYATSSSNYQFRKVLATSGRGKSLRNIFDTYGELIFKYTPCFLMSPMSVAQYIDPSKHHFDLVIFDEASQIPTSEAIGAIARGNSTIIAGDKQQMPPTNFFNATIFSSISNEDNINHDDLESLLDDAIALDLPRHRLTYHYRSHHESLIAFSNNKFYDNSLATFPSPYNQVSAVKFRYVGGDYLMGRGINKEEAKAIVKEVISRCKDKELSKRSIGIVTFNKKQMDLINDLLDEAFSKDNSLNKYPGGEEIFVKNLENVQGDERDCILFSICFGPNKKNKTMSINFGPLSREKGERRLNVAVSRAKEEMIVFSSCRSNDIRSGVSKNEGAEYLKQFLLYAENGPTSLTNDFRWAKKPIKFNFASSLAAHLTRLGYKVDLDIGTSSFKVDIAIKDPLDNSKYALGILTDDDTYVSSPTCNDRNVVGPNMLDALHWKTLRVFSSEYIDHPDVVIDNIIKTLSSPSSKSNKKEKQEIIFDKATLSNPYPHKVNYPTLNYPLVGDKPSLKTVLPSILSLESPISDELLKRRIRAIYGVGRITNKKYQIILNELRSIGATDIVFNSYTYWYSSSLLPSSITSYRVNGDRSMVDIPYEEIKLCVEDIVALQGDITIDDLCKEVLHLFGYEALTERSARHIYESIKKMGLKIN